MMAFGMDYARQPIRVLLVEDDDADADGVRRALENAKVETVVERVSDGIEALEFLRDEQFGAQPDEALILLVDINMPRLDGHGLVREIRKDPRLHRLVIFILTTSKSRDDIEQAYAGHVSGYIAKEKAGEDFIKLTSMLESFWRLVELPSLQSA